MRGFPQIARSPACQPTSAPLIIIELPVRQTPDRVASVPAPSAPHGGETDGEPRVQKQSGHGNRCRRFVLCSGHPPFYGHPLFFGHPGPRGSGAVLRTPNCSLGPTVFCGGVLWTPTTFFLWTRTGTRFSRGVLRWPFSVAVLWTPTGGRSLDTHCSFGGRSIGRHRTPTIPGPFSGHPRRRGSREGPGPDDSGGGQGVEEPPGRR